jgi:hypothetical protein
MKLSPLPILLVAVAAAFCVLKGRRVAPETDSRTIAAHVAEVVSAEDLGDYYVLYGRNGPIAVPIETPLVAALARVRFSDARALPGGIVSLSLVADPHDETRALVAAWKRPEERPGLLSLKPAN